MKYLVVLTFLLMACGASEKKAAVFGDSGGGARDGICPANYAPLPLFREGFAPLPGPDSLPAGQYFLTGTESYFRAEGTSLQAHFSDVTRGNEVIFRKICAGEAPAREILFVEFPGLREFTRGTADSHRPGSAYIQLERGIFNFTKPAAGPAQPGGIAEVLGKWGHFSIYQLSSSEYELRFYSYETLNEYKLVKRMALRFSFIPSSTP